MISKIKAQIGHSNLWRRIVGITALVLLVPLLGKLLTDEVNWSVMDFVVMGLILVVVQVLYALAASVWPAHRRWPLKLFFSCVFLYVWAELAVGILTDLGS